MSLAGMHAALIAAYDDVGRIDRERQAALIDHVLGHGLDGLFVSGSTGESNLHTLQERKDIVSSAVAHVAGRATVIAHTGGIETASSVALTEHATEAGADAISAITPFYYRYDEAGHERYYRAIAAATDLPVIAYHIPGATHVNLGANFFIRLADDGVLQGLKYTATDLLPLAEVARSAPDGFTVFNGSDEVLLGGLALGAHGGIGSTYNVIGPTYVRIGELAAAGDFDAARREQAHANAFIDTMSSHDFLVFLREMLRIDGIETGHGRDPLPTITSAERDAIRGVAAAFLEKAKER